MRWFRPPIFPNDEDKTRSSLLLNVVLNTFIIAFPVLFIGALLGDPVPARERIQIIVIITWVSILGIKCIMLTGRVALAGIFMVAIIYFATTLAIYNLGTIRAPATSLYFLTIVMGGLIISRRAIVWMAGICSATILALLLAERNGLLPQPSLTVTITQATTFTVSFAICSVLLYLAVKSIDEALARARQELAERIRVEQERENYVEQLNSRNAELVQFTYTVSHDLRNPLVTIKGFLGMLEKDLRENRRDRIQGDFQRISDAADKMQILLSQLLELSRIGRLDNPAEKIDLIQLAQDAVESLHVHIQSKDITINIAPDLPAVYGDRLRLREVMENLIDNATKYTGNQPDPLIEISVKKQDDDEPIFFVRDNGLGIEPQYHKKIFGLFDKLNPRSEGTGIGLALIKRIIEVHGGKIWVESEGLGKGSTFYFTIPERRK